MSASPILSAAALSSKTLLSVGQVAQLYGLHVNTVRNHVESGELQAVRSPGGHRRIPYAAARLCYEGVGEEEGGEGSIALYCRCSSAGQKESLVRQEERLTKTVCEREGVKPSQLRVYREIASSFGDRPQFNRLLDDICAGRVKTLYVEFRNRASRISAVTGILEHLAKSHGTTIIYLDREDTDEGDRNLDVSALIDYIHVLGCKSAAARSRLVCQKTMPEETLAAARALRAKGKTVVQIHRALVKMGHKAKRADGTDAPLSYGFVRKHLFRDQRTEVEIPVSTEHLREWTAKHLVKSEGTVTAVKDICRAYRQACKAEQRPLPSAIGIGMILRKLGFKTVKSNSWRKLKGFKLA